MINNERQYRITKAEAEKFRLAVQAFELHRHSRTDAHPRLVHAELGAMQSQLDDLLREIAEYEELQSRGAFRQ